MEKQKILVGRIVIPLLIFISSMVWHYFTAVINFEVVSDTLGVLALYYFIMSIIDYFRQ